MIREPDGLGAAAVGALRTDDPSLKASRVLALAAAWRSGDISSVGPARPPPRPARPERPELRPPRDMPRRGKVGAVGRVALLHALAHIELNAVDLACDVIARFADRDLPRSYYDDWVGVAAEEATHFQLLSGRLNRLGAAYGDLPAHDGLWEAAVATAEDLLARLAVVPLVLEARGLDVTPRMIADFRRAGDDASVAILERIYADEIKHVAVGRHWFEWTCAKRDLDPVATFHTLVRQYFKGTLKPPFNVPARDEAGFYAAYYEPLAATLPS